MTAAAGAPHGRYVAVVTSDVLGRQMAGPAIRALHIARTLAADGHRVLLVSTAGSTLGEPGLTVAHVPWHGLRSALNGVEVVVVQGFVTFHAPWLLRSKVVLVVDLYDPMQLEQLEQQRDDPPMSRWATLDLTVRVLNDQLWRGDFFLCASPEQRALWLGALAALGRVNPATYDQDSALAGLLVVAPFGLSGDPPVKSRPALRGVVDGIGVDDLLLLWAGGVYNWFDPVTLVEAVGQLAPKYPDLRLYFLGMSHPNPDVPRSAAAQRTRERAHELGLVGTAVFFNDGWTDYEDRANYLLEADIGVSTHLPHLETEFAFRTRILDYFWAGLPVITTDGDTFAGVVRNRDLGEVVPPSDVGALADAIERLGYDRARRDACRINVDRLAASYQWDLTLQPLVRFVRDAKAAPDRAVGARIVRRPVPPRTSVGRAWARARDLADEGGLALVGTRIHARLIRLAAERRR